ncbi:Cytochrome c oxidase assembly protein COX19 [Rhynchospora pubera]|uniref:Cytochrome c oxidase assembly protein COX19 n=1 Tax=Rhynchospora pubera TaxID=906938 RepID=A0AAV8FAA3_9POAL|nr:Cytochrome c oxidase assembly protein COX19 [Rhynchospora pubera]
MNPQIREKLNCEEALILCVNWKNNARILFASVCIELNLKMSAGGAFGGNRGARPVPPEKGIFPLDHLHECDQAKKEYIACLKTSGFKSEQCRHLSKKYLECRMERNLMAKQDISELGFGKEPETDTPNIDNEKIKN